MIQRLNEADRSQPYEPEGPAQPVGPSAKAPRYGGEPRSGLDLGATGEPKRAPTTGDIADRFDEFLLRIEAWFATHRMVAGGFALALLALSVAWWLGSSPGSSSVLDASLPLAPNDGSQRLTDPPNPAPSATLETPTDSSGEAQVGRGVMPSSTSTSITSRFVVHVVGEVHVPGVFPMEPEDRVADALEAAGGMTEFADVEVVNLAARLEDGMQIRVPSLDERGSSPSTLPVIRRSASSEPGSGDSAMTPTVNINTALASELESLPGVGPALSQAIVTWREENGGFVTVDDLLFVPGIGPAKLDAVRDLVQV